MSQSAKSRVEHLRREIERHNQLYYVEARNEISDFEYDKLLKELIELETKHPELSSADSPSQRVGGAPISGFETVEHAQPMYSIDNTYNEEDLRAWDERVRKALDTDQPAYVCEPKVDGVAVSLRYEKDQLVRAITRGDGRRTRRVRRLEHVPARTATCLASCCSRPRCSSQGCPPSCATSASGSSCGGRRRRAAPRARSRGRARPSGRASPGVRAGRLSARPVPQTGGRSAQPARRSIVRHGPLPPRCPCDQSRDGGGTAPGIACGHEIGVDMASAARTPPVSARCSRRRIPPGHRR